MLRRIQLYESSEFVRTECRNIQTWQVLRANFGRVAFLATRHLTRVRL